MAWTRRQIVRAGLTAIAAGAGASFLGRRVARAGPFGPLQADPNMVLDLPAGFSYEVLETAGDAMDDGYLVPGMPAGMAAFPGMAGTVVLMRAHHNDTADGPYPMNVSPPAESYDAAAMGGVTRLVVDDVTWQRVSSNLVLAGGWRTFGGAAAGDRFLVGERYFGETHGYVFSCDPMAATAQAPTVLTQYGRLVHTGVAHDPTLRVTYMLEDHPDGCLYRFVPDDPQDPEGAGVLQAFRVTGQDELDTGGMYEGQTVQGDWVEVAEPDPVTDTVRDAAHAAGAATFVRATGAWFAGGAVHIASRTGGTISAGQVFRFVDGSPASLQLVADSQDLQVLDGPHQITEAPWGDVLVSEEGAGTDYVRGVDGAGEVYDFARNRVSTGRISGLCFSPDGEALFLNLEADGMTLVVTGPWPVGGGGTGTGTGTGTGAATGSGTGGGAGSGGSTGGTGTGTGVATDSGTGTGTGGTAGGTGAGTGSTGSDASTTGGTTGSTGAPGSTSALTGTGTDGGTDSAGAATDGGCSCRTGTRADPLATAAVAAVASLVRD